MKMLYIVNARMPTEKAHGYQIAKTLEALCEEGIDGTLLFPQRKNPIHEDIQIFYSLRKVPKYIVLSNWFAFLENKMKRWYFPLQRFFFTVRAVLFALSNSFDVVYSREIGVCFILSLFRKNVIFEDHEPKMKWKKIYSFFLRHISKKVIVAHGLKELYEHFGIKPESICEIPNGVDIESFDTVGIQKSLWKKYFGIDESEKIVLYVGHFYKWKGVYTLLESAKILKDIKFVFIGGLIGDQNVLHDYGKMQGLENVYVHEFMHHEKVIPFLKSADILVLPNTAEEERSNKYTTPIKLFEYMASQVPIVASQIPSFEPYLVDQQNAILFKPDDAKDLADKIQYCIKNKEQVSGIAQNAYKTVGQYSWNNRAKKIISFI